MSDPQASVWRRSAFRDQAIAVVARSGSTAASFVLVLAFARLLSPVGFAESQLAIVVAGLSLLISDSGLTLWTTRGLASGREDARPTVLATRLLLATLSFAGLGIATTAGGAIDPKRAPGLLLPLAFVLVSGVFKNHFYAQLRHRIGVTFELTTSSIANGLESLAAVVVLIGTRDVVAALAALGAVAVADTAALGYLATRRAQLDFGVGLPSVSVARRAAREGALPLVMGAAVKCLILVLGFLAGRELLEPTELAWLVSGLRVADALLALTTILFIVPTHVRAAQGERAGLEPLQLALAGLGFAVATLAVPAVLLKRLPAPSEVGWGIWAALMVTCWFTTSGALHLQHARRRPRRTGRALVLSWAFAPLAAVTPHVPLFIYALMSLIPAGGALLSVRGDLSIANGRLQQR